MVADLVFGHGLDHVPPTALPDRAGLLPRHKQRQRDLLLRKHPAELQQRVVGLRVVHILDVECKDHVRHSQTPRSPGALRLRSETSLLRAIGLMLVSRGNVGRSPVPGKPIAPNVMQSPYPRLPPGEWPPILSPGRQHEGTLSAFLSAISEVGMTTARPNVLLLLTDSSPYQVFGGRPNRRQEQWRVD